MTTQHNENTVKDAIRLAASKAGWRLWRNNVGVAMHPDTNKPIRFGLANTSKTENSVMKSGDLIGIRPVLILPSHVGQVIGQFVSYECKREGWSFDMGDAHEMAQFNWINVINGLGGHAVFTTGEL